MRGVTVLIFLVLVRQALSARILGIIPTPSYSHQIVFQPLWKELSLRGHHVVVATTDPIKDHSLTNLTEIDISFLYVGWHERMMQIINTNTINFPKVFQMSIELFRDWSEKLLTHPDMVKLIQDPNQTFDVVMCPLIGLTSFEPSTTAFRALGNPGHPVAYPDFILPFAGELNFVERVVSCVFSIYNKYFVESQGIPLFERVIERHFGSGYPSPRLILTNASLLLTNTNPIFNTPRPLVPAIVEIGGGTHFKPAKPLEKELQQILDEADQGFIYFSLGTNVQSSYVPNSTLNAILGAFSELPYTILWKTDMENVENLPKNVIASKWYPQQDVFRHPNKKLFITQGGLQSLEEAIYNYIPVLGLPFFGDQPGNVKRVVNKGMGLMLDPRNLDKRTFKEAILELIKNPRYRDTMKKLARLALDQPMTGLEKAVWWTEYVIRNKGATHLASPYIKMSYAEYLLLDVIAFFLAVLTIVFYLTYKLFKAVVRLCFASKKKIKTK